MAQTLDSVIRVAQEFYSSGSHICAAWALSSFLSDSSDSIPSTVPSLPDLGALIDALTRAYSVVPDALCVALICRNKELLSSITTPKVAHTLTDNESITFPDRSTQDLREKGSIIVNDFDTRMRESNCDSLFKNVDGEAVIDESLLKFFNTTGTIIRKINGQKISLQLTHAFTNLGARDRFHIRHDLNYATVKSWSALVCSGALTEHKTVKSSCRYKKTVGQGRKHLFCGAQIIELFFSNFGAVLMYEERSEKAAASLFGSNHSHAPGELSHGLSKEKRAVVKKLVNEGKQSKLILRELGVSSVSSVRQVKHAIASYGGSINSRQPGQSLDILLRKVAADVQNNLQVSFSES